ncbi:MAG: hypothetical protein NPIRA02_19050 [Nitrospirales bacterium]|nr:MAG: hypothetical protein NPIRA02_19050 [Nitrospirales bacterium]
MSQECYKTSLKNYSSYPISHESYLIKKNRKTFHASNERRTPSAEQRATNAERRATSNERRATSNGFTLLELIGVIAIIAILGAVITPSVLNHLDAAARDAEDETLDGIAHAIKVYLRENRAWPPSLVSLSPDYLPTNTVQLTQNKNGFSRYFFVHPDISGIPNATGLDVNQLDDAQFLLISDLNADAAPVITNAAEFDAWWNSDDATAPDLTIHRGQVSDAYRLVTLSAAGTRGAYQIDGDVTNWDCHLQPNLTHARYHLTGTTIGLDEESPYTMPEVQFTLARDTGYRYNPCHATGSRWRVTPGANPSCRSLWFSTANAAVANGTPCLTSWSNAELLQLGNPNLTFEPGTTGGTVSSLIDMGNFTPSTNIAAMHYVGRNMTVTQPGLLVPTTIDLFEGDLLLAVAWYTVLTSTNSILVVEDDVFIFRPDTPGDYRSGTFTMLYDNLAGPFIAITGISLVEQETVVGGQTLQAGTFLYSRGWNSHKNKIYHYVPEDDGLLTTGTTLLIDGSDIDMGGTTGGSAAVVGLDLIERDVVVGGTALRAGQFLVTLDRSDNAVGNGGSISTQINDVLILDVTSTGAGSTDATATLFFEGADINLDSWIGVDSFTLAPTL